MRRTMARRVEMSSCIHAYRKDWNSVIEELLERGREIMNNQDRYAVAVKRIRTIVGHLPRKIARVCSLLLHRGGSISCQVTGGRQYSSDLPQEGLEIPCTLMFNGNIPRYGKDYRTTAVVSSSVNGED